MRITSKHLESARDLLQAASAQLSQDAAAVEAAKTKHEASKLRVHRQQVAFDQLAACFASGGDLGDFTGASLPDELQSAIGFVKKVDEEAPAPA